MTRNSAFFTPNTLIYALLTFGFATRIVQYLHNRSLWLDEAALALNIQNRDFADLLQPLDHAQSAPPAFLLSVKTLFTVFGSSEYVLRVIPLMATLITLVLLWRIAWRIVPSTANVLFVLVLFIGSIGFIGYASEFKQYASDAAIALGLLGLALKASDSYERRSLMILAVVGAAAIWASHPSIFVLGGIGIVLLIDVLRRNRSYLISIMSMGVLWLISFGAAYLLFYKSSAMNSELNDYWAFAFVSPDLQSIFGSLFGLIVFTAGGVEIGWLIVILLGFGAGLWRLPRRTSVLLLSPIPLTLLAALLRLYPFSHRLILFLIPGILLITAAGLALLWQRVYEQRRDVAIGLAVIVSGLFLVRQYIFDITEVRDAIAIVREQAPNMPFYGDEYVYFVGPYYAPEIRSIEDIQQVEQPTWVIYDNMQAHTTEEYMDQIGATIGQTFYVTGTTVRQYLPRSTP